jgi:hypothetical protein
LDRYAVATDPLENASVIQSTSRWAWETAGEMPLPKILLENFPEFVAGF